MLIVTKNLIMLGIRIKIIKFNPPSFVGKAFLFVYGDASTSNEYIIESYNEREGHFKIFGGGFYNREAFLEDLKKGVIKLQTNV
jgi:hypothetical protein